MPFILGCLSFIGDSTYLILRKIKLPFSSPLAAFKESRELVAHEVLIGPEKKVAGRRQRGKRKGQKG